MKSAGSLLLFLIPAALLVGGALWMEFAGGTGRASSAPASALAPAPSAPIKIANEGTPAAAAAGEPEAPAPASAPAARGLGADWLARNDAGIAALERGDPAQALGLFEACVEAHPAEPVFARNLAVALDALARQRQTSDLEADRETSLELLARAIDLYPGEDPKAREVRTGLERRLARWRASGQAEANYLDDGHIHFQLSYDGDSPGLRQSAPWILEQLEAAYLEFGEHFTRFPVEEGRGRIRVVLMERAAFDAATGLGDWAGGSFDGTVRVPVDQVLNDAARRRLATTLRHELLHAFVRSVGGLDVPGWLNEGLAQRLELVSPGRLAMALQLARAQLAERELFPLADLAGSLAMWKDPADIGAAYAQSLAFVEYVERQYGLREVIEMVLACGRDERPADTVKRRLGLELSVVQEDFAASLGR